MNNPGLDVFLNAAAQGSLVWVEECDGQRQVRSGRSAGGRGCPQVQALFLAALRAQFGQGATAVAEQQFGLGKGQRRLLPSRTVKRAVACAESAHSLLLAQSSLLQFECSAELLGWRLRLLSRELALEPASWSLARRRDIDAAMAAHFRGPDPMSWETVRPVLKDLLTQGLH